MKRAFVFGDTGGHAKQLFARLRLLGINTETGEIPTDTHIIHVGDLIHRGPRSADIIEFLIKVYKANPENWTQLIGNHEAQHLSLAPRFWSCNCYEQGIVKNLQYLYHRGFLKMATSVRGSIQGFDEIKLSEETLVTHAGLTHGLFSQIFGDKNPNARDVAETINRNPFIATASGEMLTGRTNKSAGILWAQVTNELHASWEHRELPFSQVHGHNALFSFTRELWYPNVSDSVKNECVKNERAFAVARPFTGGAIISIDPGFDMTADTEIQPCLVINNAIVD